MHLAIAGFDIELDRLQPRQLLESLHIIGQLADHGFELAWDFIRQLGHRAAAGDIDEVAVVDFAYINSGCVLLNDEVAGILQVLGDTKRTRKIIRRPER
ncbi:hypothetical protein D3C84_1050810 [compost metagenome]